MDALKESLKALVDQYKTEVMLAIAIVSFVLGFLAKAMVF